MAELLFIYGTLLQANNPIAHLTKNKLKYVAKGKVEGTLYDVGKYPGLINTTDNVWVYGSICEVDDKTLAILDDYEGYYPAGDQPSFYIRKEIDVYTGNAITKAWVYVYNKPVDDLPQITSGNYIQYLRQKKSPGHNTPGDI